MKELKVEDFEIRVHQISRDSDKTIVFINSRVEISENENPLIHLNFPSEGSAEECIRQNIKLINEQLNWLKENSNKIKDLIVYEDYAELAESWVKDLAESKDGYYIIDKQKVSLPIDEDAFKNSLHLSEISLHFQENELIPILEIYITCKPDYFYGHAISLYVDKDKNIELIGLGG